jgi:hypothetical protein
MTIEFIAKGIKEVKKEIDPRFTIRYQAERFREDMLAKHNILFKGIPHAVVIKYI